MSEINKNNEESLENGKIDLAENNELSNTSEEENKQQKEELTDEEKREQYIKFLKESRIRFKNTVHDGNVTHTKFNTKYKKKRNKRNKIVKKSRHNNRK